MSNIYAVKCACGAVTVHDNELNESWSMPLKIFRKNFLGMRLQIKHGYSMCNYCGNNWGVDLCACGSGNKFNECHEGFPECGTPYQKLDEIKERVL
jgi:hypothetical protein